MKKLSLSVALLSFAFTAPALAEISPNTKTGIGVNADSRVLDFALLDKNSDGALSDTELNASGKADANVFGNIDTNGDKTISRTELSAYNDTSVDTKNSATPRAMNDDRNDNSRKNNAGVSGSSNTSGSVNINTNSGAPGKTNATGSGTNSGSSSN